MPLLPESYASRRIETFDRHGGSLSTASGFVVLSGDEYFLVSNRHVLGGLTPDNRYVHRGRELPTSARVWFPSVEDPAVPVEKTFILLDEDGGHWLRHPYVPCDVAAIRLPAMPDVALRDTFIGDTWVPSGRPRIEPGQDLFVIGYPLGHDGGSKSLAIWTRASLASEPSMDIDGIPRVLIDSATRGGLSGAPVLATWPEGHPIRTDQDHSVMLTHRVTQFIGIYSGRIDERSDLGYVWRPRLIMDTLSNGVLFDPHELIR